MTSAGVYGAIALPGPKCMLGRLRAESAAAIVAAAARTLRNAASMHHRAMSKRSVQPALYEMMRSRGLTSAAQAGTRDRESEVQERDEAIELMRDDAPSASPVVERLMALLSPGRTVRLPVGYMLLACAGILLLLVGAYVIGVNAGKAIQRERLAANFDISPPPSGVTDPLTREPKPSGSPPGPSNGGVLSGDRGGAAPKDNVSAAGRPQSQWGPVVPASDPRQKGWNYFVAAETTAAGAKRLAEFCRANGLETYVVPGKNGSRVIVFPGFEGPRGAPEVIALEERIHQVGDKYKSANRHETNMHDAYPAKYDG